MSVRPTKDEKFYVITREHLQRLSEIAVVTASPASHLSCDWLIEFRKHLGGRHARNSGIGKQ
jgi:hypothetical protein